VSLYKPSNHQQIPSSPRTCAANWPTSLFQPCVTNIVQLTTKQVRNTRLQGSKIKTTLPIYKSCQKFLKITITLALHTYDHVIFKSIQCHGPVSSCVHTTALDNLRPNLPQTPPLTCAPKQPKFDIFGGVPSWKTGLPPPDPPSHTGHRRTRR
jgi:hypothetical protein